MSEQPVLSELEGNVRWIRLNRPDAMNAITPQMLLDLNEALKEADDDPETRVVVFTGSGRGFCSGLDLKQAAAGEGITGRLTQAGSRHHSTREICTVTMQRMDKPIIAAINGATAGYGLDLALGCDMRLISDEALIIPGFSRMGIIPESGGTWYLPKLIGWAKACEITMLGDNLTAEQALEYGLVNKVVPAAALTSVTTEWAEKIAANAPLAISETKRLFRHGLNQDFESHSHHVLMSLVNLTRSNDFKEAIQSYAEKRPPDFKGN